MTRLAMLALLLLAPAGVTATPAAADFAVRLPVTAAPGAGVQRLQIPASALAASRRADLADVRIFDSRGQALPMARLAMPDASVRSAVPLVALPILGRPGALRVTGLALTIDDHSGTRVARIDGTALPATTRVLGNLFDTRGVKLPAAALRLDADVPVGQPVLLIFETSTDLKRWEPLTEAMAYRAAADAALAPIELGGADLEKRYLRLRWRADAPLIGPVTVRGATLFTRTAAMPDPPHRIAVTGFETRDAHELRLAVPFATPVAAIDIAPAGVGMLAPVTIYGRDNSEAAWTRLGAATVYRLLEGGAIRQSPAVSLAPGPTAQLRIVADTRTPGFAAPPALALLVAPQRLVFVASGAPPYALVVGNPGALAAWLPPASLLPDGRRAQSLPLATVAGGAAPVAVAATPEGRWPARRLWLWTILGLGTAALAAMVLRLRKA